MCTDTKKILLSAILLTSWIPVDGQTNRFEVGLEGGPSLTVLRLRVKPIEAKFLEENDPIMSYSGGLSFQYNRSKVFSIRTALSYERKGDVFRLKDIPISDTTGNFIDGKSETRSHFDYLIVPVLARVHFGSKVKFFANSGVYLGLADFLSIFSLLGDSIFGEVYMTSSFGHHNELIFVE